MAVFVSWFHNRNIIFLSIIKLINLSVVACDWLVNAIKPIKSQLYLFMVKHDFLFSFGVCYSKGASQEEREINENKSSV